MLSIIIQEYKEGKIFVQKMSEEIINLNSSSSIQELNNHENIEFIYVTSMNCQDFCQDYDLNNEKFSGININVIGNIDSCGAARTIGGQIAKGDTLLYIDSHVCITPDSLKILLETLNRHPRSIVAPAVQPNDFPTCKPDGITGYGVAYKFDKNPFEWNWIGVSDQSKEQPVPFICGCAFSMKKSLFNILLEYGGFLGDHKGLSWEEEKCMRLWRLGHPIYCEPRSLMGHYFKGYGSHKMQTSHNEEYYKSFVIGAYINVFDPIVWQKVESLTKEKWGVDRWNKHLDYAKIKYQWLRDKMEPYKDNIDERWFLRF